MIKADGIKAFRGTMRITPTNPKFPIRDIEADWVYKPQYGCWYNSKGNSFSEDICEIIEDKTK